jgi:hypothetical protein
LKKNGEGGIPDRAQDLFFLFTEAVFFNSMIFHASPFEKGIIYTSIRLQPSPLGPEGTKP